MLLEDLGGTFVKFGQMLAMQPDIVSPAYSDELLDLLDRIAPIPFERVVTTLSAELGQAAHQLEALEPEPIATASIGQVHVAMVGGRKVAVKVQRPGIEAQIGADLRLMRAFIRLIQLVRLKSLYWLIEPTLEFASWTGDELDYREEARNMRQLGRQSAGRADTRVPEVLGQLVTKRVLVAEFLEGMSVADYLRSRLEASRRGPMAQGFDAERFAHNVANNFVRDALVHGRFHADLHPANLLMLPDSSVGYVDFGIVGSLSVYARRHLGMLTTAFLQGDLDEMHRAFLRIAVPRPDADPRAFRAGLDHLATRWYGPSGEGKLRQRITNVMFDMLTLSRRTALLPEREVTRYIRSAITVDGLIRRFAPEVNIGQELESACRATMDAGGERQLAVSLWAGAMRAVEYMVQMRIQGTAALAGVGLRARRLGDNARAVQLGALALISALAAAWSTETAGFGVNVMTVASLVMASALVLLVTIAVRAR